MSYDEERTCAACRGTGTGQTKYDACDHCDGSGHVVTCLNAGGENRHCRGELPAPEAEERGHYCGSCRVWLDHALAAE